MGIQKFRVTLLKRTGQKARVFENASAAFDCNVVVVDAMTGLYKVKGGAPMKPSELVADQLGMIRRAIIGAAREDPLRKNFVFVYSTDISHLVPREKAATQAARRAGLVPYPADCVLTKTCVWSESGEFLLEPVRFFQSKGMTRAYSLFLLDCLLEEVRNLEWEGLRATIVMDIGCPAGPHCIDLRTGKHTQYRELAFPSGEAEIRAVWWAALFAGDKAVASADIPEELAVEPSRGGKNRFVLWTTDQDLLACAMVQLMRRPEAYKGVEIDWLFDIKEDEYHMVDVVSLTRGMEDPVVGGGYNWMLLLTFAAACGTDYTAKKDFSNFVNEEMTCNFLADAAVSLREPVSLEGFADYALAALRGFHRLAKTRSETKRPVPIETMDPALRQSIVDSLNFICKYWSSLSPPVLAGI